MTNQTETDLQTRLDALIGEHERDLHSAYATDDPIQALAHVLREYQRNTADALLDLQRFQTDMVRWLQALAIVAQMVSNASTHTEKNARMRGLVEVIESALSKVRDYDYKLERFNRRGYQTDHLFANDYPVRYFKDRAEEAERKLKELEARILQGKAE
jgi:hypothetical protein